MNNKPMSYGLGYCGKMKTAKPTSLPTENDKLNMTKALKDEAELPDVKAGRKAKRSAPAPAKR